MADTKGRPGALAPEHWAMLLVLGMAGFFEGYDAAAFAVALPAIRESFGLSQSGASAWLSLVFLGALPALLVARYADVGGRRRLLLASIVGYSFFTGLTALSPNIGFFVYVQFITRLFLNAEYAIALTIVAEELPASSRGFGFGWLAMVSASGAASAAALYGLVFAPLDVSWRWLFVITIAPITVVPFLRRTVSETRLYTSSAERPRSPWYELLRPPHLQWTVLVVITDFLMALAIVGEVFAIDYMQTDRGLTATRANLVLMGASILAIPALLFAGSLSDRYGRKAVGCSFGAVGVLGSLGFFLLGRSPVVLFATLLVWQVGQFGAWPTLDAYSAELFPTELRALGGSIGLVGSVPGQFVSLAVASALIAVSGEISASFVVVSLGPVVALILFWMAFPETKGRDLADTSDLAVAYRPLKKS